MQGLVQAQVLFELGVGLIRGFGTLEVGGGVTGQVDAAEDYHAENQKGQYGLKYAYQDVPVHRLFLTQVYYLRVYNSWWPSPGNIAF